MLTLTAVGYVTGKPKIESSDYGESCNISLRCKGSNGKHMFYVNAKFYGKQMAVIERFIEDGDQITVSGTMSLATEKIKKDGTKYSSIYMNGSAFSLPPKERSGDLGDAPSRSYGPPSEEEVPF